MISLFYTIKIQSIMFFRLLKLIHTLLWFKNINFKPEGKASLWDKFLFSFKTNYFKIYLWHNPGVFSVIPPPPHKVIRNETDMKSNNTASQIQNPKVFV